MTHHDRARQRAIADTLMGEYLEGRLDRRQLLSRAALLGVSMPALTTAFWARNPGRAAAQEATPNVQLGNYEGRTLRMSVALAEDEAQVFEDVVINGFEEMTSGEIELIKI